MKKLVVLAIGLSLAGCASMSHPQPIIMPAAIPMKAKPAVVAAPAVIVTPAAPVPPATFKMRWKNRIGSGFGKVRHTHFFHQKKGN